MRNSLLTHILTWSFAFFVPLSAFSQIRENFTYWNFNNTSQLTVPTSSATGASLTYTLAPPAELTSGTGQGFSGLNALGSDGAGSHLRLNLPIGSSLNFNVPTIGYSGVIIKYETRRSGQGAGAQQISYTTDGTTFTPFTSLTVVDGDPELITLDFSSIAAVDENANFKIRIEFEADSGGVEGNNRFDNVTVSGINNNPPVDPEVELIFPRNGSTRTVARPSFRWTGNASSYTIQVSTNAAFSSYAINVPNIINTQYVHTSNLATNTLYYWRVGVVIDGTLTFSSTQTFRTHGSVTAGAISFFALEARNNADKLPETIICDVLADNSIVGLIPGGISDFDLVPTFLAGNVDSVVVNGVSQESQWTLANFSGPAVYSLYSGGNVQRQYTVQLVHTNLPVIYVNTQNEAPILNRDDYVAAVIKVIKADGTVDTNTNTEIRGRGNSTWSMPKKPYRLRLNNASSILGYPADRDWVLLANYSDKSLVRTKLGFATSASMGLPYSTRSNHVELFLNGAYQGNYQFGEHMKVAAGRVNVTPMTVADDAGENLTGGYFLELDERLDEDFWFRTSRNIPFTMKSPDEPTTNQYNYIRNYIQNFENTLFSEAFTDPENGYKKYIDTESFIRYYWVMELFKNNDAQQFSSIFFHKERNEKLKMGPVWDFDISAGNINYNDNNVPTGWWIRRGVWFQRLFQDPAFLLAANQFWNERRNEITSDLINKIDQYAAEISLSQAQNFRKWNILGVYVWPNAVVTGSYQGEVAYLKGWLQQRVEWINSQIDPVSPSKITPSITWFPPGAITVGTPLSSVQLNATASFNSTPVSGQFIYTPATGTMLPLGTDHPLTVTFVPTDTVTYSSVSETRSLSVVESGPVFYRAINFNGPAFNLDGNNWQASSSAPGLTLTGASTFANQAVNLVPPTDATRASMIRSSIWGRNVGIALGGMPSGTYQVYLYVWEDNFAQVFSVSAEGSVVQTNYNSGPAGTWARLGPFNVNMTDGTLNLTISGGDANVSGLEIWQIPPAPPQAPVLAAPLIDQETTERIIFNYTFATGTFTGNDMTYTATLINDAALPAWLTFTPLTRTFSGTPPAGSAGSLEIRVTATNSVGSANDEFRLTINPTPPPAVVTEVPDQVAIVGSLFSYTIPEDAFSGTDITYTAALTSGSALPSWLTFTGATRTFSGTPPIGSAGALDIRVTATNSGGSIYDLFELIVDTPTPPTVAVPLPDQVATVGVPFSYTFAGVTFSGDGLSYSATLPGGESVPDWLTFTAADRTFGGTPPSGSAGAINILVTATNISGSTSDEFQLVVNPPTAPALATPLVDQVATTGTPFSYTLVAGTFSGDGLVYTAQMSGGELLPPWLTFTAATRTFSGTPPSGTTGPLDIRVTATNEGGSANDEFRLTINTAPVGPTFYRAININGPATVLDGNSWQASASAPGFTTTGASSFSNQAVPLNPATDATRATMIRSSIWGKAMGISLSGVPSGTYQVYLYVWEDNFAQVFSVSMEGTVVQANYNSGSAGSWARLGPFSVNVTDGTLNVASSGGDANFSGLEIWSQAPQPPALSLPLIDQVASEGNVFSYAFAAGTFNGSSLSYTATLAAGESLPAWLTFTAGTRTFSGTPPSGSAGFVDVRVTATNAVGTADDVFRITVNPPAPPALPALAIPLVDQVTTESLAFNYTFAAGTFSGENLTYSAELSAGGSLPAWLVFTPATRTFSGTPPPGSAGPADIRVTASNASGTANDVFRITVNTAPVGPTFYRAININGPAIVIDGNSWQASASAPGFAATGALSFSNQAVTLSPATDATRASMIRSSMWGSNIAVSVSSVPSGAYQVYLYVWEDNFAQVFSVTIEGSVVQANYNSGPAGRWAKLGPFNVNVTDGTLNVSATGGDANFSGLEIWSETSGNPAGRLAFEQSPEVFTEASVDEVDLTAYPNPFASSVKVKFTPQQNGTASLTMFDARGMAVQGSGIDEVVKGRAEEIHLETATGLPNGVYVMKLVNGSYIRYLRVSLMR